MAVVSDQALLTIAIGLQFCNVICQLITCMHVVIGKAMHCEKQHVVSGEIREFHGCVVLPTLARTCQINDFRFSRLLSA